MACTTQVYDYTVNHSPQTWTEPCRAGEEGGGKDRESEVRRLCSLVRTACGNQVGVRSLGAGSVVDKMRLSRRTAWRAKKRCAAVDEKGDRRWRDAKDAQLTRMRNARQFWAKSIAWAPGEPEPLRPLRQADC